jgi:acyl-CoA synthetase (AMP-forming)/AMP-acid ligase II
MYGMTETSGTIVALARGSRSRRQPAHAERRQAAGRRGAEASSTKPATPSPVGAVGEIATRSNKNMRGYWNNSTMRPPATIDSEGWLRTGDAGYLDEDGYLFIHDRVKDMIISGGENVYPAEVESAVYGHPARSPMWP